MFLLCICVRAWSSKWLLCPSKKSIWLLTGEAPHMLENWVMALSHLSLSMQPNDVWWTVHSNGMLWWRSWDYSLAWLTITGGMKHCPSSQVNTSKVHQNGAHSPVSTFHVLSPWKYVWVHTTLRHLPLGSNPISSQFHTWVALGWIWWRSGGTIVLWWFHCEFTVILLTLLMSSWSHMMVSSKAAFISSLFLILLYMW